MTDSPEERVRVAYWAKVRATAEQRMAELETEHRQLLAARQRRFAERRARTLRLYRWLFVFAVTYVALELVWWFR